MRHTTLFSARQCNFMHAWSMHVHFPSNRDAGYALCMDDRSTWYPGSVDTHLHLDSLAAKGVPAERVIEEATVAGMAGLVDVGIRADDLSHRIARYGSSSLVRFTVGIHPTAVHPGSHVELATIEAGVEEHAPSCIVAIGEIGLDFYWSTEHREKQIDLLEAQFAIAARHGLPVVLHNRAAETEMLAALERCRPRGVMHCFAQDPDYCRRCLELGMFISFGGNLTYRRSDEIREAAGLVPDDMLLVETDSPYLSPQQVRGLPNHPGHLGFTIEALAAVRGARPDAIAELTASNARRLFGLSPASSVRP